MENKETPKEKAKRLGWLGKEEGELGKGHGGLSNILLAAVVSSVMAVLIVFLVAPTKGNLSEFKEDLESRFSTYTNSVDTKLAEISGALDTKFADYKTEISSILAGTEGRVNSLDSLVKGFDQRIYNLTGLEGRVDTAIAGIDGKVENAIAGIDTEVKTALAGIDAKVWDAIEEELEDYALRSDLDASEELIEDGTSSYRGSIYVEVVDLDDAGWIWIRANAPSGYALLIEFFDKEGLLDTRIDAPEDFSEPEGFQIVKVMHTSSLVRAFIEPIWSPYSWNNEELRLGYPQSESIDYISVEFVAVNRNRNW